MSRRILTEKEKKEYEKRISGKTSLKEKFLNANRFKKVALVILTIMISTFLVAGLIYVKIKPMRLQDILGSKYTRTEWSDNRGITAEDMKKWEIKKTYPGSLGDNAAIECLFYDKNDKLVGNITLLGHDNLFIYEGNIFQYEIPDE